MTGHRTVRIACLGLLLVAAASITGGASAALDDVTITVSQVGSPIASTSVDAQGDFSLTVKATNNTGAPINDTATLSLQLPAGVAPTSGCSGSISPYSCDVPLVLTGTASDVTVGTIALHAAPSSAGAYPSRAGSASTTGGRTIDPFAYDISVAGVADLALDDSVTLPDPSTIDPSLSGNVGVAGDPRGLTYSWKVTNTGPSDNAGGFVVSDTLPVGTVTVGSLPSGCGSTGTGVSGDPAVVSCTSGDLGAGASRTITVNAKVLASTLDAASYADSASLSPASGATTDPTTPDTDSAPYQLVTRADLEVTGMTVSSPSCADSGTPGTPCLNADSSATATLTLTFQNNGPSDAQNATFAAPTRLVTQSVSTISPLPIPPSGSRTVTIVVKADPCLGHHTTTCTPARQTGPIAVKSTPLVNVALPTTDPTGGNNSITLTGNNRYLNIDTVASPPQHAFAIPGTGNAILTWETPSGDGGQSITSYTITVTPPPGKPAVAGSPFTVPVGPHTSFCGGVNAHDCYHLTVSGLQNDSTMGPYMFSVVAVNTVGNSDPGTALATPSVNAKNAVIPTNTSQTLTTCTTASPTSPTCVQYVIPSGNGGVFGAQGNFNLTTGFCGGSNCSSPTGQPANTKNGGVNLGSLAGYTNFKLPILEVITWDFSTFTAFQVQHPTFQNIPVYYEQSGASQAGVLPMCTNQSWALSPAQAASHPFTGSACVKKLNVLGSKSNPAANGDIQFQVNLTSDSDGLAGHH